MSPRLQAEVERFELWQRNHVTSEQVIQEVPVQGWHDAHSWDSGLPHPNSTPNSLPGSIDWLYQDYGGEG